jgi:transcriptional regulator with XRE-family HTH domain
VKPAFVPLFEPAPPTQLSEDHPRPEPSLVQETFGDHVRRELRARQWTVRYLALRSGVSHSTISRLISGPRVPTLETARRLHAAFGRPDALTFFGVSARQTGDPINRIGEALRADRELDPVAIAMVMRAYLGARAAAAQRRHTIAVRSGPRALRLAPERSAMGPHALIEDRESPG